MNELTKKQAEILAFIVDYIKTEGKSPSQSNICDHFGFKSKTAVRTHLYYLEKKGHINMELNTARGIHLVDKAGLPSLKDAWFAYTGNFSRGIPFANFAAGFRYGRYGNLNKK